MLDSVLKYKRAFECLTLHGKNFVTCPSSEDWNIGELIRDFLAPSDIITTLFYGSSYPASNFYFMQICAIECLLRENENSDDLINKEMSTRMKVKFDKYWSEYSIILAIVVVLDPRMKLEIIKFCHVKIDPVGWKDKLDVVKQKMYELFSCYETSSSFTPTLTMSMNASSTSIQASSSCSSQATHVNYFGDFLDFSNDDHATKKSDIDRYLEEGKLDAKRHINMDVLQY
nr:zinc finger BED domain-containing protein RICESLEEPER 2-like [Ipomoea batatas]